MKYDIISAPARGSSPRMWGTLYRFALNKQFTRFIPTHVGNTLYTKPEKLKITVHPHACGEHIGKLKTADTCSGSSPRMWGTLFQTESKQV